MSIAQYLSRYAEPETTAFDAFTHHYQHVLCIPAFAESPSMLDNLSDALGDREVLVIVVVNAPQTATEDQRQTTQAQAAALRHHHRLLQQLADNIHLLQGPGQSHILLVERCRPGNYIDPQGGVGQARKIACDIACKLIHADKIASPWMHSTDADTCLPADYFMAPAFLNAATDSTAIYPFRHRPHPDQTRHLALQLYELSLHYYVAGLQWAGSPWAFHTIGSTLLINASHYAKVRGFPKRLAGEDFYLLEKLAKTGNIVSLDTSPVLIDNRLSDRVPFGTGPAVTRIMALDNPLEEYGFYHPDCFAALKCWLTMANTLEPGQKGKLEKHTMEEIIRMSSISLDSELILDSLMAIGVEDALAHANSNSRSKAVFTRHLHTWFDAFTTLKFIHTLRDKGFPSLPLAVIQAETSHPFVEVLAGFAADSACAPARPA